MSFPAKYEGRCAECFGHIAPGELIEAAEMGWKHVECPVDPAVDLRPTEVVCTTCWLVKPCACDD